MHLIRHFLIDMDGVLWHGDRPQPALANFFAALNRHADGFILATNNASKTPAQYVAKLAGMGVAVRPEQILTSALATAAHLQRSAPAGSRVYVVGGAGLKRALSDAGLRVLNDAPAPNGAPRPSLDDPAADVVAVGLDMAATYADFAAATVHINRGARFVGTNPDRSYPSEWGPLPGAGSFLALLEAATGVAPTVIGKPGPIIFAEGLRRLGAQAETTAMIGDRLSTDIAGGHAAGLYTILVLSGISRREDLAAAGVQPDLIVDDIAALAQRLNSLRSVRP